MPKYLYYALGIVTFFVIVNVLMLDFLFASQRTNLLDFQTRMTQMSDNIKNLGTIISVGKIATESAGTITTPTGIPTQQLLAGGSTCPQSCISLINASKTTTPTVAPVVTQTNVANGGEYFIPMGTGSVVYTDYSSSNWKTLTGAQATFDAGNYGTIKAAYFEAFMHVETIGDVHSRLFDATTPAVFFATDKSTNQSTSTFVSTPITLTPGSKTYKVQIYSTQSTGYLDQSRIRIVVQ